jgi:protease I
MKNISYLLYLLVIVAVLTNCSEKRNSVNINVAVLLTEGFHGEETYIPIGYLINKGINVTVIGPKKGTVQSWDKVYSIEIEKALGDISIDDFDMLIIPGGSSPAKMREIPEVVDFTINFYNTGKTVASICHGPQLLAATGILNGVNATGVSDIQEELEAAGAFYINEAVVVDNNLITSRDPDDIPSFIVAVADAVINQK